MKKYLKTNVSIIKKFLMKDLVMDLWDGEDEEDVELVVESINEIVGFENDGMNGFNGVDINGDGVNLGFSIIKSKKDIEEDEVVSYKRRKINGKTVYFVYYDF
jgi:hypothetical protein